MPTIKSTVIATMRRNLMDETMDSSFGFMVMLNDLMAPKDKSGLLLDKAWNNFFDP